MKDGTLRICLIAAELLELDSETCVVTVINDITERKQAEAALSQLNAHAGATGGRAHCGTRAQQP